MQILLTFDDLERWLPEKDLQALKREAVRKGVPIGELVKEGMMEKARRINGTAPKRNGHKKGAAA